MCAHGIYQLSKKQPYLAEDIFWNIALIRKVDGCLKQGHDVQHLLTPGTGLTLKHSPS